MSAYLTRRLATSIVVVRPWIVQYGAVPTVAGNLVADVALTVADPRIRLA